MAFGETNRPLEFAPAPYRGCRIGIEFGKPDLYFRAIDIGHGDQIFETRRELRTAVDAAKLNGTFYGDPNAP